MPVDLKLLSATFNRGPPASPRPECQHTGLAHVARPLGAVLHGETRSRPLARTADRSGECYDNGFLGLRGSIRIFSQVAP